MFFFRKNAPFLILILKSGTPIFGEAWGGRSVGRAAILQMGGRTPVGGRPPIWKALILASSLGMQAPLLLNDWHIMGYNYTHREKSVHFFLLKLFYLSKPCLLPSAAKIAVLFSRNCLSPQPMLKRKMKIFIGQTFPCLSLHSTLK